MKKIISILLVSIIAIASFSGCARKSGTYQIGVVQIVQHPSLDNIRTAFLSEMKAEGYENGKNIKIDYQNANGDQTTLKTICQKFAGRKYNLIVAISTPAAQAAETEAKPLNIPVLYCAVSDPVGAGLIQEPKHPGGNITGTSDVIDVGRIFTLAEKITPNRKTIGAIYNASESNSVSEMKNVRDYAAKHGMTVVEATITNASEIRQAAESLAGKKVDCIFVPIDNTVASAMASVTSVARQAKIPLYVSADTQVGDGGLATSGVSDTELGKATGEMAVKIIKGSKPGDLAAKFIYNDEACINQTTADAIGLKVPDDILKSAKIYK